MELSDFWPEKNWGCWGCFHLFLFEVLTFMSPKRLEMIRGSLNGNHFGEELNLMLRCMVILRDFPYNRGCLGWCHVSWPLFTRRSISTWLVFFRCQVEVPHCHWRRCCHGDPAILWIFIAINIGNDMVKLENKSGLRKQTTWLVDVFFFQKGMNF